MNRIGEPEFYIGDRNRQYTTMPELVKKNKPEYENSSLDEQRNDAAELQVAGASEPSPQPDPAPVIGGKKKLAKRGKSNWAAFDAKRQKKAGQHQQQQMKHHQRAAALRSKAAQYSAKAEARAKQMDAAAAMHGTAAQAALKGDINGYNSAAAGAQAALRG